MGEVSRIYNSSYEIAIRVLLILKTLPANQTSVHRLMILDYLALNTFDIGGPASLHAPVPNRGVQVFSRKEVIEKSLKLLISKNLLSVVPTNRGIEYKITVFGKKYLTYFESKYFKRLSERVNWVAHNFSDFSDKRLNLFVEENLSKWGEEFISEDNLASSL